MTQIFCSHKLKNFLGPKYFTLIEDCNPNIYGDWNAHLFYNGGRKYLILVNNKSFYSVFLGNIKKADFKDFSTLFFNRLAEQLLYDNVIKPSEVDITIQKYTSPIFASTNNDRKTIGTINDFVYQFEVRRQHSYWFDKDLLEYNSSINDSLTGAGKTKTEKYGNPIKDMRNLLNANL